MVSFPTILESDECRDWGFCHGFQRSETEVAFQKPLDLAQDVGLILPDHGPGITEDVSAPSE